MAITTTSITGVIALPDGTIPSKSSVTFTMTGFDTDATAGVTIAPRSVTSVLSDTGALDVDLWSNEDGERTTFYSVSLNIYNGTNPLVFDAGKIEVPTTGGPYDLNDLLPIAPPQGATVAEYIAQLQAAAASATSAADSAAIDAAAAAVDADDAAISAQEAAVSAASINPTNFLAKADNLAGIANTGTARTNLGLGTAATSATGDFATAAQGTKADNALPAADKATQLEAETGTDNDKYMTPLRTAEAIESSISTPFTSSPQTVTLLSTLTVAHGLASIPTELDLYLVCTTADPPFAVGDRMRAPTAAQIQSFLYNTTISSDGTNVKVRTGTAISAHLDTGAPKNLTASSWNYIIIARI